MRGAIVGALLLGALPLWTLPLISAGSNGFLAYLGLSPYYGGARKVFGAGLFPVEEFGIMPNGVAGVLVATALYAALGAVWAVATAVTRWRQAPSRGI